MAGSGGGDTEGAIYDINVTPLVDITLVLLIIMMVTAKIIVSHGVPLKLPNAATGEEVPKVFQVDLTADGKIYVDRAIVKNEENLVTMARDAKKKKEDLRAVIRAADDVDHGKVFELIGKLRDAGVGKIAFAVTPSQALKPEDLK
jgi:biopolymer transport protein ExbD